VVDEAAVIFMSEASVNLRSNSHNTYQQKSKVSEEASVSLFSVSLNLSYLFGLVLKQEKTSF
jgi:hypothetical protein